MPRGFCGCCSLYASAIVALVFTLFQCVFGLIWNAELLMVLDNKTDIYLSRYVNVEHLDDTEVVKGMTLASTGLHNVWIIFVLLAFKGNASLTHGLLTPYVTLTYLITLFDIGGTIYFSIKFQEKFVYSEGLFYSTSGGGNAGLTYFTIGILFSRGCLLWFLNVYFTHLVERRGKEIDENYSALTFYVLTQLSRALREHDPQQEVPPDTPPPYYPNYMPQYIVEATRDTLESSWALNDTLPRTISNANSTGFSNPLYSRTSRDHAGEHQSPTPVNRDVESQRTLP